MMRLPLPQRIRRRSGFPIVAVVCLCLLPTAFSGDGIIQQVQDQTDVGVGFDHLEPGPHDLTMTLQAAGAATAIDYSDAWDVNGTILWTSTDNFTSAFEHHWTANGVTGNDVVTPEFFGYTNDGPPMMYGIFHVAVSHIDIDLDDGSGGGGMPPMPGMPDPMDEAESSTGVGMPITFNGPDLPAVFPFGDETGRTLTVNITSSSGGTLYFDGTGNQLAVYRMGGTGWEKITTGITVPAGGLFDTYLVHTSNQFTGPVDLKARLEHDTTSLDAADVVKVVYDPTIPTPEPDLGVDLDVDSNNDGEIDSLDEVIEDQPDGVTVLVGCTQTAELAITHPEGEDLSGFEVKIIATNVQVSNGGAPADSLTFLIGSGDPNSFIPATIEIHPKTDGMGEPIEGGGTLEMQLVMAGMVQYTDVVAVFVAKPGDLKIKKIVVYYLATLLSDGPTIPADTDVCVAIKLPGPPGVGLRAVTDPEVAPEKIPAGTITWTGGTADPGRDGLRWVSSDAAAKVSVKAAAGGTEYTMITYIVWADPTDFRPRTGMNPDGEFDDIAAGAVGPPTGRFGPIANGTFSSISQSQFTVKPAVLMTDADKIFRAADIRWDLYRELRGLFFEFTGGMWKAVGNARRFGNDTAGWRKDDFFQSIEDKTPWGTGNGHIYNSDQPGRSAAIDAAVSSVLHSVNLREWARVRFVGISTSTTFARCSESNYWHALRTTTRGAAGVWIEAAGFPNDCGLGINSWGTLPPDFTPKMPRITTTSMMAGTMGMAYSATIAANRASAFPAGSSEIIVAVC